MSGGRSQLPAGLSKRRRGWGLLQMLGALFAGTLVLGACVPLILAGQREADVGTVRARMTATAREVSARIKEDVRQATAVEVGAGGRELTLILTRVSRPGVADRVTYRQTGSGLVRELRPGAAGRPAERFAYGKLLSECRFTRQHQTVSARLSFGSRISGRDVRYALECTATPRSAL